MYIYHPCNIRYVKVIAHLSRCHFVDCTRAHRRTHKRIQSRTQSYIFPNTRIHARVHSLTDRILLVVGIYILSAKMLTLKHFLVISCICFIKLHITSHIVSYPIHNIIIYYMVKPEDIRSHLPCFAPTFAPMSKGDLLKI